MTNKPRRIKKKNESEGLIYDHDYIRDKARLYLSIGPEKYRIRDAFHEPDLSLTEEDLKLLEKGCRQICDGKGFSSDDPICDIGISGFYNLAILFHFIIIKQKATQYNERDFLDKMLCEHIVTKQTIEFYNIVIND